MYPTVDQAKRDEIQAYLLKGYNISKTVEKCKVSCTVVQAERRKLNLTLPTSKFESCSVGTVNKIKRLLRGGQSMAYVAKVCGLHRSTIKAYQLKYDLPPGRPRNVPVSDETREKIKQLLLDGMSIYKARKVCKVSTDVAREVAFFNDIPCHLKPCDEKTVEKIQKQIISGKTPHEIAKEHGVSAVFVRLVKKKYNIRIPTNIGVPISDEKVEHVKKCLEEGMPAITAAKSCGICMSTVTNIANKLNIPLKFAKKPNITPSEKEEMKKRLEAGETCVNVAAALGLSPSSVYNFKKRNKIISPPKPRAIPVPHLRKPLRARINMEDKLKIKNLLERLPSTYVAGITGYPQWTVNKIKKDYQIPTLPKPSVPFRRFVKIKQLMASGEDPYRVANSCRISVQMLERLKTEYEEVLSLIEEQQQDSKRALGTTPLKRIEFLDEIPFCVLL
ncbi:hypothetical protein BC940DRAFT_322013 [Gongronella butleri]|nr:hypothetical protein BC940DRAFT_322013 [Gongronella butleri]